MMAGDRQIRDEKSIAVRHAIVMARIKRRMIHFGEDEVPAERDDYVLHRASLEQMLAGSYRWD